VQTPFRRKLHIISRDT